jgi:hypothetical protein
MQVSSRTSGLSNTALLNDQTNVNAAGLVLEGIQSKNGSSAAVLGSYYNSGKYGPRLPQSANYGLRVNSYTNINLSPTIGDRAIRATAGAASGGVSSVLSSLSAALTSLSSVLKSLSK